MSLSAASPAGRFSGSGVVSGSATLRSVCRSSLAVSAPPASTAAGASAPASPGASDAAFPAAAVCVVAPSSPVSGAVSLTSASVVSATSVTMVSVVSPPSSAAGVMSGAVMAGGVSGFAGVAAEVTTGCTSQAASASAASPTGRKRNFGTMIVRTRWNDRMNKPGSGWKLRQRTLDQPCLCWQTTYQPVGRPIICSGQAHLFRASALSSCVCWPTCLHQPARRQSDPCPPGALYADCCYRPVQKECRCPSLSMF